MNPQLAHELQVANLDQEQPLGVYVLGFGRDDAAEIYALSTESGGTTGSKGNVWRLELAP